MAREQGTVPYEPDRPDNLHRLNMGVFPPAPRSSQPVQQDPRLRSLGAGVLLRARLSGDGASDDRVGARHALRAPAPRSSRHVERSVIVFGAMEAALTPLMEAIEASFPGVKVFSLPSVDHPQWGRHIELGVKGEAALLDAAYAPLLARMAVRRARAGPRIGALRRTGAAPSRHCTVRHVHRKVAAPGKGDWHGFLLHSRAHAPFWGTEACFSRLRIPKHQTSAPRR